MSGSFTLASSKLVTALVGAVVLAGIGGASYATTPGQDKIRTGLGLAAEPPGFVRTTLDSPEVGGSGYSSVWIGADGLGLISYQGGYNGDRLKVAHCSNLACSSATRVTLDAVSSGYSSVWIGADGLGLIAYFDDAKRNPKVAHCSNLVCSAATTGTLEARGTSEASPR